MNKELKYSSIDLEDIKAISNGLKNEVKELNTQKRVIEAKIELLYETINKIELHIMGIEQSNKEQKNDNT